MGEDGSLCCAEVKYDDFHEKWQTLLVLAVVVGDLGAIRRIVKWLVVVWCGHDVPMGDGE